MQPTGAVSVYTLARGGQAAPGLRLTKGNGMTATYRPIPGYPGYHAGTDGSIRSTKQCRDTILKPRKDKDGYPTYRPMVDGVAVPACGHKLVLLAYHGPCPPGLECRHLDGNRANNRPDNLCWGTHSENVLDMVRHGTHNTRGSRNGMAKLQSTDIGVVRHLYHEVKLTQVRIGEFFGVSRACVGDILAKRQWKSE